MSLVILTDFPRIPKQWKVANLDGETNAALVGASFKNLLHLIPDIRRADLILVHESGSRVLSLVLLFWIFPFLKKPIVSVDLILRKPSTTSQKLAAWFKKILLRRVDHFIHYFQALEGYEKIYGISLARSSYVPFKANLFANPKAAAIASQEKENYVYAAGWSLRDFDTFFEAVSGLKYPAAIPRPNFEQLQRHGARFTWDIKNLPPNVTLLEDDGSQESWIKNLCKARIVVIPTLRDTLRAAGISVYLDAMLLKKCVIISSGPGVSDVLTDQAIIIPPEDPAALRQAIQNVWEDAALREEIALRGQRYATALGGEPELMNRILKCAVNWHLTRVQPQSRLSVGP